MLQQTIQKYEESNERKGKQREQKRIKKSISINLYKFTIQIKKKFFPHQKT